MVSTARDLPEPYPAFVAQAEEFAVVAQSRYPKPGSLADVLSLPPRPLDPVLIDDVGRLSTSEREALTDAFFGSHGVAHFVIRRHSQRINGRHAILALAEELQFDLPLRFPIVHPLETHPEALAQFGEPDGTLKVYNVPIPESEDRYREVAETKEMFAAHNDGMGYAGGVAAVILMLDSPPSWGGYTCFQNLVRMSLLLRDHDPDAFEALFIPDAMTAVRPRGKGALKVVAPVLYINDVDEPQSFFRVASGEYEIRWREDVAALTRARKLLLDLAQPFALGSTFVHLMRPGEGVIIRNTDVIHSRTPFEDEALGTRRVLARKWFAASAELAPYRHAPGLNIARRYARLLPQYFSDEMQHGEWNWDAEQDRNVLRT